MKKLLFIFLAAIALPNTVNANENNFNEFTQKFNEFLKCFKDNVKEEFEETKEFQIKKWKEAKNQNKKTFSVVQHKLTSFFSDFPNPKGDK